MAQTNFTPILLYASSTPTNVPSAANLTNSATGSEIAINVADKNLFFKDSGGTVNTVPIRQSSTSSNGWLSSTDWNTFNNKAPATSGTSLLYGNGSGGFSNVTIGSGISFAGGTLSATGSGGTVTSVAATVPAFLSVSGSPITTSGTLAITLSGTALPVANGGTGITTTPTNGQIPIGNGTNYTAAAITAGLNIAVTNGAGSISVATNIPTPQTTVYTSGSGTYTVPANTKYIVVEMVGGGGGGGGGGTSGTVTSGAAGGNTTFGSNTANGGGGGNISTYGGTATLASGFTGIAMTGNSGQGFAAFQGAVIYGTGSIGGAGPWGGCSFGQANGPGSSATANSGAGGAGGGTGLSASLLYSQAGGSAGGYIKALATSLAATYSYAVGAGGAGGAAGTSGYDGGNGGSGQIIITAYF